MMLINYYLYLLNEKERNNQYFTIRQAIPER
jgi:hypothetical protein